MSRTKANSLDYFPLDVTFFSDQRIRRLQGRFGSDGPVFLLYIYCRCYGDNGYYLEANNDFYEDAAIDIGCSVEKIGLMLNYLLDRSLLDSKSFNMVKVLTSHGIQAQYQKSKKGCKRDVVVDETLWILDSEETEVFIKVRSKIQNSEKNCDNSEKYNDNSRKYEQSKVKKSKVKEIKGDTDAREARPAAADNPVPFEKIKALYNTICTSFPKIKVIDGERRKAVSARWKTYSSIEVFEELFSKTQASDFMKGSNDRNWTADFDWVMKPTNMAKVLEGRYDNDRMMGGKSYRSSGQKGRYGKPATVPDSEDVERKKLEYMRAMAAKMAEVDS